MNYVQGLSISKYVADKLLFENINISINKGQKVALIAKNGSGKTSLINLIAQLDQPDYGTLTIHKNIQVGYLKQEPNFLAGTTILENIFDSENENLNVLAAYNLELARPNPNAKTLEKYYDKIDQNNLWDLESKVKQILGKLKIFDLEQKMETLSGGQVKRVALAKELLKEPQLLILDEPTNHLDIEMIEWLENYIHKHCDALLIVTHDRYFLDNVTTEIIELDNGKIFKYQGNYSYYLEKKNERIEIEKASYDRNTKLYKKELEWIRRSPSARGTKPKARIESFNTAKQIKKSGAKKEDEVKLSVETARLGKKIMEIQDISKSFGDKKILKDFTYIFNRYDRIGIVGNNGTGKSTLLNIITGELKPDTGKIVTGKTIVFGFFKQGTEALNPEKKIIEAIQDIAEYLKFSDGRSYSAAQLLERFQFDRKKQYQYIKTLSGGEKRRLYLLTVLMKNPNFLILDEPTNDLDIETLNILEDFLEDYAGVLIMVSHDRYFMDKLIDHLFVFQGEGKIIDYPGNYTNFRNSKSVAIKSTEPKKEQTKPKKIKKEKSKLSYNEKREFEQLEKDIDKLEEKKSELEKVINQGITDYQNLQKCTQELGEVIKTLNKKSDRWLELSEYV